MNVDYSQCNPLGLMAESLVATNRRILLSVTLKTVGGCPFTVHLDSEPTPSFLWQFHGQAPTLGRLVEVLVRRSASHEYVAKRFGVIVTLYNELPTFRQSMSQIEYTRL